MIFHILLLLMAIYSSLETDKKCLDTYDECNSVDYKSYKNCQRTRQKRSIGCDTNCSECDCESCNISNCINSCNSCCSSCCENYMPCGTNDCCRKTCKDQCNSSDCRRKCGSNCYTIIKLNHENNSSVVAKNDNKANITTIITVNNIINTTNDISIPIQIDNTNVQNITLFSEEFRGNGSGQSQCCIVISPRQCIPTHESPYVKCFHHRTRQCGDFCTATVVHKEERQICQSGYPGITPNCNSKIIYIPQPQPRCRYLYTWPYVSCGIKKSASCSGCYRKEHANTYMICPSECYDNGFGTDLYYRRGPFYRGPYLRENGFEAYGYGGGYGGFDANPPYGRLSGVPLPHPHDDFNFENASPGGTDPISNDFQPIMSMTQRPDQINVGPAFSNGYDASRNIRETEVDGNRKPNISVYTKVKRNEEINVMRL